jgi:hypothetical protein
MNLQYPMGSMVLDGGGIYANIGGTLMGSMLLYITAPWILWGWEKHPTKGAQRLQKLLPLEESEAVSNGRI